MATAVELIELQNECNYPCQNGIYGETKDIERRSINSIAYSEFFWKYMNKNRPIILTNASKNWKCSKDWISEAVDVEDINNDVPSVFKTKINFEYLKEKMNNCMVPVSDCSTEYFNSHKKREIPFFEFLGHWQSTIEFNSLENQNHPTTENLYLKDWHLRSQLPNYEFYMVPQQFASDWLNEYLVNNGHDDYRFVYMGPKGTWTPFHADVFGSFSWSTNIMGCKKWLLLPPGEETKLIDSLGNVPFQISEAKLLSHNVKFYTIYQRQHEALFVPSGWYHQVWNVTDTISVNHNWFNACNVQRIWKNFTMNMKQVKAEINDCRQMDNFEDHCQMMLRASFGMNYFEFLELLEYIVNQRLNSIKNGNFSTNKQSSNLSNTDKSNMYIFNDYHIQFELQSISRVVELMLQDPTVSDSRAVLYRRCVKLLDLIKG